MSDFDEYEDISEESSDDESLSEEEHKDILPQKEEEEPSLSDDESLKSTQEEDDDLYGGKLNPSDYKRTGGFAGEHIGTLREGGRGRYSNLYEIFISQIYIALRDSDTQSQEIKNYAEGYSRRIPKERLLLLNIDVLVPTLIFLAMYREDTPNPQEIENFLKKYKNVNPFDFIRYYRHIQKYI